MDLLLEKERKKLTKPVLITKGDKVAQRKVTASKKTKKSRESSVKFVSKVYTVDYMLKNPSSNAKAHKHVWQAAVLEYLFQEGVDLSDKKNFQKPIAGIQFAGIINIYNTLLGKKKTKVSKKKKA